VSTFPHDLAAEQALLGACLLKDSAIDVSSEIVTPADFHKPQHQTIYAAILEAWAQGSVDSVTVHQRCGDIADLAYLHELQNVTPAISHAGRYANIIADHALRRKLIAASAQIAELGWQRSNTIDAVDAADQARALLADLHIPTGRGAPDVDVATFIASVDTAYDWLIPNVLERRDRMLITASEGGGKSVLLAQIAVQTAAGIHPWTLEPMAPRNVTIIDLENSDRLIRRRLESLVKVAGDRLDPMRLRIHARPNGLDLTKTPDKRWLLDRCIANAAELLVIGPVYRMMAGAASKGDAGAEDQTRQVTKALDEIRTRCNVTLLMESHAPHSQNGLGRDLRPFGSSVWLRWPEFGFGLRKEDDNGRYLFEAWRGPRDVRQWPTMLARDAGEWMWTPIMPTGTYRHP
jgi:hypothetical protein